jgi:hypothetical protein
MNINSKNDDDEQHTRLQIGIVLTFVLGVLFIILAFTVGNDDDDDENDKNDNNKPSNPENGGGEAKVPESENFQCKLDGSLTTELDEMKKPGFFRQGDVDMMIMSNAKEDVRRKHFPLTFKDGVTDFYSPQNFSIRIFEQNNTENPDKPPFFIELETSYNRMQLFQVTEGVDESGPERRLLSSESLKFDEKSEFMQYHMEAVGLRRVDTNTYMVHLSALWLKNEQCGIPSNRVENKNEHRVVYIGLNNKTGDWDIVQMVQLQDVEGRVYSITLQDDEKMLVYVDTKEKLHKTFATGADLPVSVQTDQTDQTYQTFSSISPIFTMKEDDTYCYVYAWGSDNQLYRVRFSFGNNDGQFQVDQVTLNYDSNKSKTDFSSSEYVYVNNLTADGSMFTLYDQSAWSVYVRESSKNSTEFRHLYTSTDNESISDIEGLYLNSNDTDELNFDMWVATDDGVVNSKIRCQ